MELETRSQSPTVEDDASSSPCSSHDDQDHDNDSPITNGSSQPQISHQPTDYNLVRDRSKRPIIRSSKYSADKYVLAYALLVGEETAVGADPSSYSEAISSPDSFKWLVAMNEKINSLHKNGTWNLVELPKGRKEIA